MAPVFRVVVTVLLLVLPVATPAQTPEPYILFSPNGRCSSDGIGCAGYFTTYYVFINMRDITDAVGASFRLESEAFVPADFASVDPHEDVTIVSGDLFSGIELAWPAGSYVSDTLLTIPIASWSDPGWVPGLVVDVEVYRASGDTLRLMDGPFYCSHCYGGYGGLYWLHPAAFEVPAGVDTTLAIKVDTSGDGATGTFLDAADDNGWLTGCTYCSVYVDCGGCPWDYQWVYVHLTIPADAGGMTDRVSLVPTGPCCIGENTSFAVNVVAPVAAEKSSWGAVKSKFKPE